MVQYLSVDTEYIPVATPDLWFPETYYLRSTRHQQRQQRAASSQTEPSITFRGVQ